MSDGLEGISAEGQAFWRRVYAKVTAAAHAEIVGQLGQMWRGGRVQWPFLLPGHGYELQQTGVQNFSTSDLAITTDLATASPIDYPIGYDVLTATPRVFAQSQETDWVATAYPTPGTEHTQITVALKRADSRTLTQFGTASGTILSGQPYADVTVTFAATFATSTPVVVPTTTSAHCRASLFSESATGAVFRVNYVPDSPDGIVGYNVTGIKPSAGAERTDAAGAQTVTSTLSGADILSSGGPSDNESDLTTTNTDSTGGASTTNHVHSIPPGTDAGGGTSGGGGANHTHGVGDHSHALKHHTHGVDTLDHTHDVTTADHTHGLTEPISGGNTGHNHGFTGSAFDAPANTAFTLHYVALGGKVVSAASVDVAWLAIGIQAS